MRASTAHRDRNPTVQMTPMIDVVFQLLIFFICTASFAAVEELLSLSLGSVPLPMRRIAMLVALAAVAGFYLLGLLSGSRLLQRLPPGPILRRPAVGRPAVR